MIKISKKASDKESFQLASRPFFINKKQPDDFSTRLLSRELNPSLVCGQGF